MFTIERYSAEHRVALIEMFRLHVPEYFAAEEEKDLIMYLDNFADNLFVYIKDGIMAGCGGHNIDGTTGKLSWYITHPDYCGTGVGTALAVHNLQLMKNDKNLERIIVRTSQFAYKFYERIGFELISVQNDYWAKGLDLYEMELQ